MTDDVYAYALHEIGELKHTGTPHACRNIKPNHLRTARRYRPEL